MNQVNLIGRLVRDPEVRTTQNGDMVTQITLAVDRPMAKDKTDFITCIFWKKAAEIIGNTMYKGRQLGVGGHLTIRSYEGNDGQKRWVTEVVCDKFDYCGPKPTQLREAPASETPATSSADQFGHDVPNPDDEIPF